jgi:hypothetical protein
MKTGIPLGLALVSAFALAGCGPAGGVTFPVTGGVIAENQSGGGFFPYAMMDFALWPSGAIPSSVNLLPFPLGVGEAAWVAEVVSGYYDADAFMQNALLLSYLETWFGVPVPAGVDTAFVAF